MEKIVITGGLGYIGTELCKIYSGEARFKNIIVIDNKFVSERVNQLRNWGINFIQCSILDKEELKSILKDANVVYHLAGITDVAYVKTESSEEKDKSIIDVGINGTQNVIDFTSNECKIIFPSTHVVYEGLKDTKFNITEEEPTSPILTYAKGKVKSEKDLFNSKKNFIILRLASVYGYSNDTMRIGIMPNLFSKITSQNGIIKLFSRGIQHKSMVAVKDVVRAMKFLAESNINREIFHISNESKTIKQVAELCKKINPKVTIIETDNEIPNLGYTISNQKLINTGFKFLYNLETCIEEMIHNWSKIPHPEELEYIINGSKEYIDDRGKISNYELPEPINMIGYIESKKGTLRANHYHPIQEQKCLLIKGKYISIIKDLSIPDAKTETRIINAGDLSVIRPNVAHTMVFLEDSIFLNLVRGEREHENYGITHTIPYKLVDDTFKNNLLNNYKYSCRACDGMDLKNVISLGISPLANNLSNSTDEVIEKYPLEMQYCSNCHNCQLSYSVPATKMFDNYLYVSSTTSAFREHFEKAASKYIYDFNLTKDDLIVDIGSNDGISLLPFKEKGIQVLGIEPAKNICNIAINKGINTINSYFDDSIVELFEAKKIKATIVTASNVFAHSNSLKEMALNVFKILKDDGVFIIEVQYLLNTLEDLTFDNIYHEHVNYWSVTSLNNFFKKLKLKIIKVEHIETHGGSIRVFIKKDNNNIIDVDYDTNVDVSVMSFLVKENQQGITNYDTYKKFSNSIKDIREIVQKNIKTLKQIYGKIAGYGSPAKATTALNYFGIDNKYIDYIIEDNTLKHGKYIPGVNIPIKDKAYAYQNMPNVIIVMAWNFFNEIKNNNEYFINEGVQFISIKDLQNPNFQISLEKQIK